MNFAGGISSYILSCKLPRRWTSARYQSFLYTDACTPPLNIGKISVFLICRRIYFAVVHRRDFSIPYIDPPTSLLYIGEISVFLIYRRMYLTDVHRWDISLPYTQTHLPCRCSPAKYQSLPYMQTHLPRRCTSARYQFSLYTDAPSTSPLNIGEISVFLIYWHMYFAVVHRRDISLPHVQTNLPRWCSTARFRSSLYTDTCTSPLYIGEEVVLY